MAGLKCGRALVRFVASRSKALSRAPPLEYGDRVVEGYLPDAVLSEGRLLPLRTPQGAQEIPDSDAALKRSLEVSSTPKLGPSLGQWLETRYRGGGVAIIVDDYTRPCVHQRLLLPGLLEWLLTHGVGRERIAILIATATHRTPRPEEYPHMLGEKVWTAWRDATFPHNDLEGLVRLGTMPDGVPVELNGRAARAELILSLSDLDYHYFAGVTGGPKHLVPGIAGRALTTADHLRMFGDLGFAPNVDMGILDGNPVYEYKKKAVRILLAALRARGTFVYSVITVLDPHHKIVGLEGGAILTLHRRMRSVLDQVYVAEVPRLADIVIVSARHLGINAYQAGKAINAAVRVVRPGGSVVCLAPCPDGLGNDEFRRLMEVGARILSRAAVETSDNPPAEGASAINRALGAVQEVVKSDFRIGRQKPVDLLVQYRRTGWGNLWLLCEGLTDEEREILPFRYIGTSGEDPSRRLRDWIEVREQKGRPTYAVLDDPTYWIRVAGSASGKG